MQYIEAPNYTKIVHPSVFLAGGITNCPDWQAELCKLLDDCAVTVLNPRRANFPIENVNAAQKQIEWEYKRLRYADLVSFWFSRGSLNPIVLFELGAALERDVDIVIGVDPKYERRQDVAIQSRLRRPIAALATQDNLPALARAIKTMLLGI